jgi:preprotein translocase subunit SecG
MASYIRESQTEAIGQEGPDDHAAGGAGGPDPDATFLTVSGRDKSVQKSTAFVTALFITASIGLVLMAKKSHVQSTGATPAKDSQAQIEMAINRVTGVSSDMTLRMDEIVQKFSEFSDVSQVKVAELNKNPFELVITHAEKDIKDEIVPQDAQVKSLLKQLDVERKALSLISIIQSESNTSCMINGVFVKVGEPVNGFVVEKIQADHVQLVWQPDGDVAKVLPFDMRTVKLALKE